MNEILKIKSDHIITPDGEFDGVLHIQDGKIVDISNGACASADCLDYTGLYVSPGFIDIHTHGAGGHAFLNSSEEEVLLGCDFHLQHGTTTILPTVSAAPFKEMYTSVSNIANAMKSGKSSCNILGAHLEGPYLSAEQCGAQSSNHLTPPIKNDYECMVDEFGKYITRWTYAPERDVDGDFCRFLIKNGITPSIGHTEAKYSDVSLAIQNGCKLITHLYSCTSTVTRSKGFRSLGVIESAFLRDELFVEIIGDGKHLPVELVQMIVKIKGFDKVILITDSLEIAGTEIKCGKMGDTDFIVEDGVCKLKDRSAFAGSVATADKMLSFMVRECGFDVVDVVRMMTKNPADILGINKGSLSVGYDADIVVFDKDFAVTDVFVSGKNIKYYKVSA